MPNLHHKNYLNRAISKILWAVIIIVIIAIAAAGSYIFISTSTQTTSSNVSVIESFLGNTAVESNVLYTGTGKGYFSNNHLAVTIVNNPGGSAAAITAVAAGRTDFGVADIPTLMHMSEVQSNLTNVRVIGTFYQAEPFAILFLNNSGIKTPKDLEGKTIGTFQGSPVQAFCPLFAKNAGFNASAVQIQYMSVQTEYSALLTGKVNAIELYTSDYWALEPQALKQGLSVSYFAYYNYGFEAYGLSIITSTNMINSNPTVVSEFVKAFYQSEQYAITNPQFAVKEDANNTGADYNTELNLFTQSGIPILTNLTGSQVSSLSDPRTLGLISAVTMQETANVVASAFHKIGRAHV